MPSPKKSFNHQLKSALVQKQIQKELKTNCCTKFELIAMVHFKGSVIINQKKLDRKNHVLFINVESAPVARYLFRILKKITGAAPQILYRKDNRLGHTSFLIRPVDTQRLKNLVGGLNRKGGSSWRIVPPLSSSSFLSKCCRRSYLRGAFLVAGSMNAPGSGYHLEIFSEYEDYARLIKKLMKYFELEAGVRQRNNGYYTYLKKADSIMEFLRIIGAHGTLLQMENRRVWKSMRNHVNRMVNCETANLEKSLQASQHQLEIIQKIQALWGLDNLPKSLREAAHLRLKHPEASLKELGEMLDPPVGKSGMNHRFRKMDQLYRQMEKPSPCKR